MTRARALGALLVLAGTAALAVRTWNAGDAPPASAETKSNAALIEAFEAQVAANPEDTESFGLLGKLYLIDAQDGGPLAHYLLAEKRLRVALAAEPTSTRLQGTLAEALLGQGRYRDALALAEDVWERDHGELRSLTVIGDALAALGRYDEAERIYERLREAKPAPAILARLGQLAETRGDFGRAHGLLAQALASARAGAGEPGGATWFLTRLCRFHLARGALDEARGFCERALAIREEVATLALLGAISCADGRTDEAITRYERATELRGDDPLVHAELADVYEIAGKPEAAARHAARALEIAESAPIPRFYRRFLSAFYVDREGGATRALELAREEIAERPDAYTWDLLAAALFAGGRIDEAAEASDKSLARGVAEPRFHYHAGLIEHARGDRDAARRHFERALALNPYFSLKHAASARKFLDELRRRVPEPVAGRRAARSSVAYVVPRFRRRLTRRSTPPPANDFERSPFT